MLSQQRLLHVLLALLDPLEGLSKVHRIVRCSVAVVCVQDYKLLSDNVAVRSSGSSTARDAAAAQDALTSYMQVGTASTHRHSAIDAMALPAGCVSSSVAQQRLLP
jgi:hypothetical protein